MGTGNWGIAYTVVAGADLSSQQYKFVNLSGVLATSASNAYGILQNKPESGQHAQVVSKGRSKIYMATSIGDGAYIGQSGANSGQVAIVTSGAVALGWMIKAASSGSVGTAELFGGPSYIAI
jgi:hypothetical protein